MASSGIVLTASHSVLCVNCHYLAVFRPHYIFSSAHTFSVLLALNMNLVKVLRKAPSIFQITESLPLYLSAL